jgi:hypothetical protein
MSCDFDIESYYLNEMVIIYFRVEIQRRLQEALLVDVELSNKKNIEQMLWKSVFYQVIEMLRHQIAEGSDSDAKQQLMTVLDDVSRAKFLEKFCLVFYVCVCVLDKILGRN